MAREGKSIPRAHWIFGQLLEWHLLRGTRPGGKIDHPGRKWSAKSFAEAVGFGDRTIRYWLRNEHLPPETETIERVLFGNDACYAEWRLELRHAHARSWAAKGNEVAPALPEPHSQTRAALPASNIPVRVPTHFMGREDALAGIETALDRYEGRVAITALHGLRGVGKTTLAAAYAERHRGDYRATWWIRAQTEPGMRADLVALGIRLGWVGAEDKEEPAVEAVMERLRHEGEGILLIFDNAVDADALKSYLPRGGVARVLVTSNAHAWRGVAALVEIRLWPKEIGADYLIARTGRAAERAAAELLSDALGGLPLAHEQAAAYCERLDISLADYRKRFEAAPARLLDDARHAPAEYHDGLTVAKTFALAIEEAAKLNPAAEPLIIHAAHLAPEAIPLFLFCEGREKLGEPLATALAGDGLDEAVAALRAFALVDRETIVDERDRSITTDTIRLHRLVREVAAARREGKARDQLRRALAATLAAVYPDDGYINPASWPRCAPLTPHLLVICDTEMADAAANAECADLLDGAGSYFGGRAAYSGARPLCERALAIREKVLGPEHGLTARSIGLLAFVLQDQGDLVGARPLCERALAIREKVFGPEHPETAQSLNQLAGLLRDQGDSAGAQPLCERALAIREKVLGPEHPATANSINLLAFLRQEQGDLAGARPLSERALAIREKVLGPEHHATGQSRTQLAWLLFDQGDLAGAQPLCERGLAIREKVLGPEHPDLRFSLSLLGFLLHEQDNLAGARPLFERALAICEKVLGPEHPATAQSLNRLAWLLRDQGDLAKARTLCERGLAIREKVLGLEHPETAWSLNNLAFLLRAQGDLAGARPLFERALAIFEKALGAEHPDTAKSLNLLGGILREQGDLAKARPLCERGLAIREKVVGAEHTDTAWSLNNLALLLLAEGDLRGARPLFERALTIFEKARGREHPDSNRVRCDFARMLLADGNVAQAVTFSGAALAAHEKTFGKDHPWTKDSARVAADALDALSRADEAAALRARHCIDDEGQRKT